MSTKKSLLITIDFPPQIGGAGYYISQVALHLPQKDLVILAPKMENSEIFDREQRYKIYRKNLISKLCFIWPKWLPLLYKSLKIVKKERIKTIQVGQVLPVGIVALFIKKLFRIPYIVYTNAMDVTMPAARHGRKKRILKSVLKEAYKVITISEFTKGELIKLGVKKENIVIVRPCTDILEKIKNQKSKIKNVKEEIVKKYNLKNKRILLTVGRLVKRKGHDMVIRALPKAIEKVPNLVYVITSTGPCLEELRKLTQELNLEDKVVFTGTTSQETLIVLYEISDVFIMTSRELSSRDVEGFGIVYLEANALEKPVIAGRSGGVEDAVQDGVNGLLVDPENTREIAETIVRLMTNQELANKLGVQGKERVLREFNWKKEIKKIERVLS
ncbi:MAG: hypothetical protein COX43_02955 [Parcubacteria group bacterium CG23_combo_of_CG06-09_8_20_14_all_35_9]|nr:MAG: hypothetical protein COX43_02955 [Parcubacteria group bacterium CG23_combo_of_CG06-09_8_20_14_all_35_9]